jgi:hypothetical protein
MAHSTLPTSTRSGEARRSLHEKYQSLIEVNPSLTRALVSYQANRHRPFYRWLKYKEGFSAALVEFILGAESSPGGSLLDPFAGSGAALFGAAEAGWRASGIELLPVGVHAIRARLATESINPELLRDLLRKVKLGAWKVKPKPAWEFKHLRITRGAFTEQTEHDLASFRTYVNEFVRDEALRALLHLACLNVLEDVSFTRKDGQYLRWDERAQRKLAGKRFNKGAVPDFRSALNGQLDLMLADLGETELFGGRTSLRKLAVDVHEGSCLTRLPDLKANSFDLVMTSPPYCNRYDYSRTYALELAYLGVDDQQLKDLRQSLLSCTVENRAKANELSTHYADRNSSLFQAAMSAFEQQGALHEVLSILEDDAHQGKLNNTNIPRMVRNYFLEMSLVIHEIGRLLRLGGRAVMVNDNVQYSGEEVPVDLILSEFAASAGMTTERIWTLGRGKGNSSQQMGAHGRKELRKCVYLWRKIS